ncbi:3-phenylpropionate/cinnamic acid dioxygenase subunit beta [Frankia sp. AgB1.9]|uniref:3-phenylpropionate/cinnamic acid dioxygenase subunit beta n=1 Tax=unclassified Frankia TaxID=2632575 RepID=UPI0019328256|nr:MULTISPECIES: 3-phenylpropionate/cinnamic acid dioxygenase subunit beta [unclassified Frankia]MBL7487658.1 3-phenylpropionate/cinnamic acid dioxygenase subunit beta [Frankia sp. AgW1.1]MBL7550036.1 3-phenylpropionate/cinnamic acid dioxygenase subunit beta [Frankia sp. AgB1.9]MBL7621899.1 3-phenylpropionate/cinnamic acid dioxygenase subunit beta [Frankia sp. AgB1.8]
MSTSTEGSSVILAGGRADRDVHFEVAQFYYEEAELLDEGRYTDWLDLLDDDLDYWMPTRTNRLRRQQALSVAARGEAAFYDETKESLAWRIRRFDSGMAWAEDPPSRTRHLVTNIVAHHVNPAERPEFCADDLVVRAAFLVYRNRLEREENVFAGRRTDILRRRDGTLRVARRAILLDQNVLQAKNISTFF